MLLKKPYVTALNTVLIPLTQVFTCLQKPSSFGAAPRHRTHCNTLPILGSQAITSVSRIIPKPLNGSMRNASKEPTGFIVPVFEKYKEIWWKKAQIQKDAKNFEALHDDAQKHAQIFGITVIFLQIAILLSSIAALMKKKPVWVLGLILGLIMGAFGVIYFINGFFLFLPVSYLLF